MNPSEKRDLYGDGGYKWCTFLGGKGTKSKCFQETNNILSNKIQG